MRISSNMGFSTALRNISSLEEMNYKDLIRQSTGKEIINIADNPSNLMDLKKINAAKLQRENYINVNSLAIVEMQTAEEQADAMLDGLQQIRDLSVSSTNPAYDGGVAALGTFIKGIISDIIRNANMDFNGKYLFSGTMTNANSITAANPPGVNNMPFELVEEAATAENPSGLRVIFKGNTADRSINKDTHSTEIINLKADELFGDGGTTAFQPIIEIYNKLMFTADGEQRMSLDSMSREEMGEIANWQQQVALDIESVAKNLGAFASRRVRLETVTFQMKEEVIRIKEVKSLKEEANITEVLTNLKKQETALQYTLQAASSLNRRSLFDFLG